MLITTRYPCPAYKNPSDYYLDLVTLDDLSPEAMLESSQRVEQLSSIYQVFKNIFPTLHLAPPRADYEQAFAGANFNTEIVSGAPLRSPEHIF